MTLERKQLLEYQFDDIESCLVPQLVCPIDLFPMIYCLFHIQNQFEAKDQIPYTARNLRAIFYVANTRTEIFDALLRAMRAFEI